MHAPPKWLSQGYIVLFFLLPWSLDTDLGFCHMSLPSEPIIGALGLGLAWLFWQKPLVFQGVFFRNRLLQISLIYLGWMSISACYSTLPLVSWKYWLVEAGHWWVFAVGVSVWPELWRRALPGFVFSLAGVAIYSLLHHGFYDFRADQALLAPMPFFPDHTMWAAVLVMGLFLGNMALKSPVKPLLLLLFLALVFSTCRAAWISVGLAGAVWGFLSLGKTGRWVLLLASLVVVFWGAQKMNSSFAQDVSARERLNRWHCALRMTRDKPLLGFGPGTFQFKYLDYQEPAEMTRISLSVPVEGRGPDTYGRGGGAHSEYLRPLAETGWPGLIFWLGILFAVLASFFVPLASIAGSFPKISKSPQVLHIKPTLPAQLALLTFFLHGVVNDFMHDGRIAALVWGCLAIIFTIKKED